MESCAWAVARGAVDKTDSKLTAIIEAHEAFGGALKERVVGLERARAEFVKREHRGHRRAKGNERARF